MTHYNCHYIELIIKLANTKIKEYGTKKES
jgi:hypothetical protein